MSRFIVLSGRFSIVALLVSLLTLSSFGQVQLVEALDFDGDKKVDYTIFRPSDNAWYILGSLGTFRYQAWGLATEDRLVPGDYDGDDKADVAVYRDSEGGWYVINSSTFTFTFTSWGMSGDEPVARDYDGDGRTDYAIVRRAGGQMTWWFLMSGGAVGAANWGLDTDFAVPGDYDGDGKFDMAVQRQEGSTSTAPGTFYVYGSNTGFFGVSWGFGTDYVVPGDYDGDSKTDFAVVREGALPTDPLVWYILRSDGQGFIGETFGLTGDDYNAQGDYDGDGKTDIAVWRQSDASFYVKGSLNQQIFSLPWGLPGDLPLAAYDTH